MEAVNQAKHNYLTYAKWRSTTQLFLPTDVSAHTCTCDASQDEIQQIKYNLCIK